MQPTQEIKIQEHDRTIFNQHIILGVRPEEILRKINEINVLMLGLPECVCREKAKLGAFLRIAELHPRRLCRPKSVFLRQFGYVKSEKVKKYSEVTLRKILQLHCNSDHLSSHLSRDGMKYWGGAYCIDFYDDIYVISISGFDEVSDETAGLALGLELNWISLNFATKVVKISGNKLFSALYPKLPSMQD